MVGGLLAGWDRRISARMQSRQGPPILQPFYDVLKLWQKENIVVRRSQNFYILFFLLLVDLHRRAVLRRVGPAAGDLRADAGGDLLRARRLQGQFALQLHRGGTRADPDDGLRADGAADGHRHVHGRRRAFQVDDIASHPTLLVLALPGVFLGFLYTLEIKFRKSPFDLSCSHHAHQELVRGITTEFSGRTLALIEIAHWYENVFLLGWVYLFFAASPALGVAVSLLVFVFVILVDNVFARLKWQTALRSAWVVAAVLGFGNILVLSFLRSSATCLCHAWLQKSPWIIHYDASSCNGCDIETLACLTPLYDVERLGVVNTGNPKHADIFLVTGAVNEQSRRRHPQHLPPDAGAEGGGGGGHLRLQRRHLPRVLQHLRRRGQRDPGGRVCAGLRGAAGGHHRRRGPGPGGAGRKAPGHGRPWRDSIDKILYLRAEKSDAPEILALQKIAYQSEAEMYGDESLPALQQTLEELENDFERMPQREATVLRRAARNAERNRIIVFSRRWSTARSSARSRLCRGRHRLPEPA